VLRVVDAVLYILLVFLVSFAAEQLEVFALQFGRSRISAETASTSWRLLLEYVRGRRKGRLFAWACLEHRQRYLVVHVYAGKVIAMSTGRVEQNLVLFVN